MAVTASMNNIVMGQMLVSAGTNNGHTTPSLYLNTMTTSSSSINSYARIATYSNTIDDYTQPTRQSVQVSFSLDQLWSMLVAHSPAQSDGSRRLRVPTGALELELPDGSIVKTDVQGNFKIYDQDAKVIYKGNRIREFNKFLNASDLLTKFIQYLDQLDVRRTEVLELPIELFVKWLVIESAKADGEDLPANEEAELVERLKREAVVDAVLPANAVLLLPAPALKPRCGCGRWLKGERHARGLLFCSGAHMDRYEPVLMEKSK